MSRESAAGGAATVGGVVYQTLWCLLRSLKVRLGATDGAASDVSMIVIEPSGGGGDLQVHGSTVYVEQLKASANQGTWSLQTVIEAVLPDLFLAAHKFGAGNCKYRFVTEGRLGGWGHVYHFFQSLKERAHGDDPVAALIDSTPLEFRRNRKGEKNRQPFFHLERYPEKELFILIAEHLLRRPAIADLRLETSALHKLLWNLLASFEFVAGQTQEAVEKEIDTLLLAVVGRREDIPSTTRTLAMSLLERSSRGNAIVDPVEFFAEHGLSATSLKDWQAIRAAARRELRATNRFLRFDPTLDVRWKSIAALYAEWKASHRLLVLTGESGAGKTWSLRALAEHASADEATVVWVDARGDAEQDAQRAADIFWLDIRGGNDGPIRLREICHRLNQLVGFVDPPRLRIFLTMFRLTTKPPNWSVNWDTKPTFRLR